MRLHEHPPIEEWDVRKASTPKGILETHSICSLGFSDLRIFHLFDKKMGPFYRRPAQYLASSMGLAGYNESDVIAAIKTLLHYDA